MTLGLNKSHFFSVYNSKNEPKKRRLDEVMNGLSEDHLHHIQQIHNHHSYETPSKRSRSARIDDNTPQDTPQDITINTHPRDSSAFVKNPMSAIKSMWNRLRGKTDSHESSSVVTSSSDNAMNPMNPMPSQSHTTTQTNVYNNNRVMNTTELSFPALYSMNTSTDHSSGVPFQAVGTDVKRKQRLSGSYKLDEKRKYKQLLNSHLGTGFRFHFKRSTTKMSADIVDLTSSQSSHSLRSEELSTTYPTPKYSRELLDTKERTHLVERIKSKGITADPTIRLNTISTSTPFGAKDILFSYSTRKPSLINGNETQFSHLSQSSPTTHPIPESSKRFGQMLENNRNFLDNKWTSDLRNSLNADSARTQSKLLRSEQIVSQYKAKRETDFYALSPSLLKPINRTELKPFIPYIESIGDIEEEEEDVEEESAAVLPALTPEMDQEIDNAFKSGNNVLLVDAFLCQIYGKDIKTLYGLNWLNDEIINFYMSLIVERGKCDNFRTVHAFNTFFYKKLKDSGPQGLKRWTRKIDVFANAYVFIPIHLGMHWCLAVIDFVNKRIEYYDSMGGSNYECVESLKDWLQNESVDKKKTEFPMTDWTLAMVTDIPQQMNGSDCGMFACKYAEYIARDARINFSQAHMPYFRRRMVYEILNKRLL